MCTSACPSVDETAWAQLEPGTASPAQRLRAVRQLTDAGVDAGVLMMPLVPGITTLRSSIERTLCAIAAAGAKFVGVNVAHLEEGVREHFFEFLARDYPHSAGGLPSALRARLRAEGLHERDQRDRQDDRGATGDLPGALTAAATALAASPSAP